MDVTVDADGRAAGISFVDGRFRETRAPRLGDSVLEALTTARAEVAARATAVMMAANLRLPPSTNHAHRDESAMFHTMIRDTSSVRWRRLVREARAVASGPVAARESGGVRAEGVAGRWDPAAEVLDASRSRPQGPLWGRSRPGARSAPAHAPQSPELRDAVVALRESVCGAVGNSCLP
ncbi:hypothetical protein ACFY6U_06195 [Streptomyces sp. NPDC013157]|uniref:hypothetical protein n=1 Tax=Streptomyces sp. NPDC013157 TaxID=3364861 RepID=UPI00369DF576